MHQNNKLNFSQLIEDHFFWLTCSCNLLSLILKEHYHVFAHAREFDFRAGGQEFKDAGIDIELSQIRLHRPQSTLALP